MNPANAPFAIASVAVFVTFEDKILAGERIYNTSVVGGPEWSITGGKIDFGETPEEAAVRETREECGLEIEDLRFLTYKTECFPSFGKHFICLYFTARAKSPNAINVEPTKIARWTWFRPEEFPKNSFGKIDEVISEFLLPKG